jgi:hypothetical protein
MAKYCRCGATVHPVRQKYGYKTCAPCSGVERVASAPITNHKTGNTIQIASGITSHLVFKHSYWHCDDAFDTPKIIVVRDG